MSCTLDSISHSAAQTQRMGMRLGELLRGGELILLDGQLGTGKTTFTQGLAQGMGITENVNSPTFILLKEYAGQLLSHTPPRRGPALYHFDLYRLDNTAEMIELGIEDYFYTPRFSLPHSPETPPSFWPTEHLNIRMKMMTETKR